jgi:predicted N-formylglutamate amidohydrolase
MAVQLDARLIANEYSLDLVDVTRSPRHRQLFPPAIRKWPAEDRQRLIDTIYQPYRDRVREALQTALGRWSYVIHLSVRTFALRSGNKILRADMGLLYDPSVDDEVDLCLDWIDVMYDRLPMLRVRRNYPRRGTTDSITKAMRSELAGQPYLGIELMLGRAWAGRPVAIRDEVIDGICSSLREVADHGQSEAA